MQPLLIFKGKVLLHSWFEELEYGWRIAVSPNGWTSHEIGINWLKNTFIPGTPTRIRGKYQLLIFDGHGCHVTEEFYDTCQENNIIPLCMPPHASHLLQPLDVGCFGALKRAYSLQILEKSHLGIESIDKLEFLSSYAHSRIDAFKKSTIINSFGATGLVPLDSDRLIRKLDIQPCVSTPPGTPEREWEPKTPSNGNELEKQAALIEPMIRAVQNGPFHILKGLLMQVYKGFNMALHRITLQDKEIASLRAALEKKKVRDGYSRKQIRGEADLSVEDVFPTLPETLESYEARTYENGEDILTTLDSPTRGPRLCGICRNPGHRRQTCPERP